MVASLVAEHGLQGTWASVVASCRLSSCDSRALEHRLGTSGPQVSFSVACGIFPDQGWNPCFLHWQVDSLPLSHQGSLSNKKRERESESMCGYYSRTQISQFAQPFF